MLYDFLWSDSDPEPDPENLTGSGSEKKVRIRNTGPGMAELLSVRQPHTATSQQEMNKFCVLAVCDNSCVLPTGQLHHTQLCAQPRPAESHRQVRQFYL